VINTPIHGDGVTTDSDRQRSPTPDDGTHGALDRNLNEGLTGPASILFESFSPPTERRKSQMVVFTVLPLSETAALPLIDPGCPQFRFAFHVRDYPRVGNSSEGAVRRTLTRERVEPVLESFKEWLTKKSETVLPSSLVGKAVEYTLGQWDKLVRYLDRAELASDNNVAENAVRPFVLGRKNFLFSGSPRGATASCNLYSIIETAKQNGMNPYGYLYYCHVSH
jgi:hypothetical protein